MLPCLTVTQESEQKNGASTPDFRAHLSKPSDVYFNLNKGFDLIHFNDHLKSIFKKIFEMSFERSDNGPIKANQLV